MKAIDMAKVIRKHRGYFVALSHDRKRVWGKGLSPEVALKKAKEKGIKEPIVARIPEDSRSYLL